MSKRFLDLPTVSSVSSDDYLAIDGSSGTRKITPENIVGNSAVAQRLEGHIADANNVIDGLQTNMGEAQSDIEELKNFVNVFVADVDESVQAWLDDHPEATTTVQDGAITETKLAPALKLKTIKDYVTPEMFGAVGDGVTDDTQAFKNMLASGKDMIIIPDGNYYISDTLVFPTGKDVTCIGLLVFHNVTTAVVLGNASINKFNIRSLRISSSSFDETSIGIKIIACIESNFSNLFANLFGTNIYVSGESGANAYNTFINPIATRGKYNFKVYGPELSKHCNENYIFGGRLFASSNTVRQMSIEGSAASWSVFGLSAEGAGECAVYCDSAYCVFNQIRTEGTWSVAGIVLGENSDRCRVFSTRYDATIQDNGTYNSYFTNRMGSKLITSTQNVPALTLQTELIGSLYDVFKVIIGGYERFKIDGAGKAITHIAWITQSGYAFKPFKIGNNVFWIVNGILWTKNSDPESETDGYPVGREYRAYTSSPVDVLTPKFIGDEVLDTRNKIWYKAVGTEKADWVALN